MTTFAPTYGNCLATNAWLESIFAHALTTGEGHLTGMITR